MKEDFEKIEKMAKELYLKFFTEAYLSQPPDEEILKIKRERCWIHAQAFYHYTDENKNEESKNEQK